MRFHIAVPDDSPAGFGLPWHLPLRDWDDPRMVEMPMGLSRNLVRFAAHEGTMYAIKEVPDRVATREYKLLRSLNDLNLPVVQPVALITERSGGQGVLMGIVVTRFLEYSLPYRSLLSDEQHMIHRDRLLDALVGLLVRLHLAGFHWGDCSLSNSLFRRDAGRLAAYLVDAETGELHAKLSTGQRRHDLELAEMNVAGELMDVAAAGVLPVQLDPVETAAELVRRYKALWTELTRNEIIGRDEQYRVEARIKALNSLGFDVEELELTTTAGGTRMAMRARVVERGYHSARLLSLTGIRAEENQSRELLNDLYRFRATVAAEQGRSMPEAMAAYRWLTEMYDPILQAVPHDQRDKLDGPELFCQILEHRWFMSEAAGQDIGTSEALHSYLTSILPKLPSQGLSELTQRNQDEKEHPSDPRNV